MTPIERTSPGMLVFLGCGCAAMRCQTHPTGAASLVSLLRPCETHAAEGTRVLAVRSGEPVSSYVRRHATLEPGSA